MGTTATPPTPLAMPKALPFRGVYGPYERATASGTSYFVQFERRDRRTRRSLTLDAKTPSLAYAEAVDYGRRFEAGLFDPWTDAAEAVTFAEGVRRWLAHNPRLSKHTLKERRITLHAFAAALPMGGRLDARDVTPEHVRAFTHAPHLKASTQAGYHSKVRACFNWLKAEGYVRESPCDAVKKPKPAKRPPRFLSRTEFGALLAQAHSDACTGAGPAWMPDLVELGVATGLRLGDVCRLEWSRVRLDAGVILVDDRTKTGHEYAVPLLRLAREVLDRQRAEQEEMGIPPPEAGGDGLVFHSPYPIRGKWRPLSRNNLQHKLRSIREKARLRDEISFHTMRHTFATWMLMQTGNIRLVSSMLGHTSVTQTETYAHVALLAARQIRPAEFEALGVAWEEYAQGSAAAYGLHV